MNFRPQKSRRSEPNLDLTPLIDVVFLLLIFFLVTATFAQQEQSLVPVDLPQGSSGEQASNNEQLTVYVEADGSYALHVDEDAPIVGLTFDEVRDQLEALRASRPETPLFLRGDQDVRYGDVMRVFDSARAMGFERVYNVIYQE